MEEVLQKLKEGSNVKAQLWNAKRDGAMNTQ
jgi:hypothetical protein